MINAELLVNSRRTIGRVDSKLFGHFIEHFHRQIYGGICTVGTEGASGAGTLSFRHDVIDAVRRIRPPVIRWPGGCFVSAYHWKDGVGATRQPSFDKAWRVAESNLFGTNEFIELCRLVDAEPYLCTNAGSGTAEEMSDWVEYCNLTSEGRWARQRAADGFPLPHPVKFWSIGNENYGDWEIGAKSAKEWSLFVRESAKMMKAVDPSISLAAASVPDLDWNLALLREAGRYLDWIAVHGYWDPLWERDEPSGYELCMAYTTTIAGTIERTEHILGALGLLGSVNIAFDEWNLRGWHHPHRMSATEDYLGPRDRNDINSTYTMADAVFSACFLNECLRHCRTVRMANFAPLVNARGLIYAYDGGIVLRPTYHVFDLYANNVGAEVVDSWIDGNESFPVAAREPTVRVPAIDAVATRTERELRIALVNRSPDDDAAVRIRGFEPGHFSSAVHHVLTASSTDSFNDIGAPDRVAPRTQRYSLDGRDETSVRLAAHSVNVVVLS